MKNKLVPMSPSSVDDLRNLREATSLKSDRAVIAYALRLVAETKGVDHLAKAAEITKELRLEELERERQAILNPAQYIA